MYLYSRLTKTITNQVIFLIEEEFVTHIISMINTSKEFYIWINNIFDDFDHTTIAQNKINNLCQTNRLYQKYLVDFQKYIININYNTIVIKAIFKRDLFIKI